MTRADLTAAVGFLTVVRVGEVQAPGAAAVALFPAVGAAVGLVVGLVWWGTESWLGIALAAALALVVDLALTGMLHVDGLADAGDGLLPPLPRERRLEVMADPHIGAFGTVTVVATLLVRFAALASATPAPLVLAGVWATSRAVMGLAVAGRPHARRDGGLGAGFAGGPRTLLLAVAVPLALVPAALGAGLAGLAAVAATAAASVGVVAFGERRLGGWTGDVLGAAGVVGETVGLVVLAGRW